MAAELSLPNWYLGAGAVAQTVWNVLHGYHASDGVKDYDLVYFVPSDLSAEVERAIEESGGSALATGGECRREERDTRSLWYEHRFGRRIYPYRSAEEAIATWPTKVPSVGVRLDDNGFVVCAPFGVADLFEMVVRPNKALVSKELYEEKAKRWSLRWPMLTVIPWTVPARPTR